MPAPYGPPWGRSYRRTSQPNPNLRVSHDERTEVADRLSKHYGDGRLDEEEFNERLDRAMKAKTQSDLDGLLDDLPNTREPKEVEPQMFRTRRALLPRILFIVLIVLLASAVWHAVTAPFWVFGGGVFIPWVVIAVVALLLWRSGAWYRRRP
jgi:Domain of unknown function (DUF1707)